MTMIISGSDGLEFPDGSDQGTAFTGNAATITSGTIDTARLATGTANSSTYLRGDQTWAAIASSQWTTTGSDIYYNTGNVGIGTTSPDVKLQVAGTIYAAPNKTTGAVLVLSADAAGANGAEIEATYYGGSYGPLKFKVGGSERMRIDSSGNIYVGSDTTCNLTDFRSKSLTTDGYQKLAGGLIIQWGVASANINQTAITVTLPIAFPNALFSAVATISGANNVIGNGVGQVQTNTFTTTSFNIFGDYTSASATGVPTSWIAIGY
jgi:hypothetical protein